eukprot:3173554-Pyramimonas_sp.AAC.1
MKKQRRPRSKVHVAVDYHHVAKRVRVSAGQASRQNLCDQREMTRRKIMAVYIGVKNANTFR